MTSAPIRDQDGDHLITPQNAGARGDRLPAVPVRDGPFDGPGAAAEERRLDRQDSQGVSGCRSSTRPSTSHPASNNRPSPSWPSCSRTSPPIDPHERQLVGDTNFVAAVRATGRRKLIFCALWTEVCMAFAALDALSEGYEVYPVVDSIGGHIRGGAPAGIERVVQAGGVPSAGSRSHASYSATGTGWRRCRRSWRSCSPTGC